MTILPADTYTVINKTIINDSDRKVLIMLYQPIIGSEAIGVYFSLWSDLDKQEIMSVSHTHHHLIKTMGVSLKEMLESREKLEAIGLLKTFFKKDSVNSYIYELYSPIGAKAFFEHPVLNITLYNNLGKIEYEKITNYFKMPVIKTGEYEDITKKFSDVYEGSPKDYNVNEVCNIKSININNLDIESKLDYNLIISNLEGIVSDKVFNKTLKELIDNLTFIYDLDSYEICNIIRNSINSNGVIDKETLRKNARNYYQFENNGSLPYLIYKKQPEHLRNPIGDTSKRARMIYTFETITPYELLKSKAGGVEPTSRDLKIIESLLVDMKLNSGVVNVLVDYVLKINNNKLTKNFIETIAAQWKRLKIETVEKAMEVAEKEHKRITKSKNSKKMVEKPVWFDKQVETKKTSDKEIEELQDMLNSI